MSIFSKISDTVHYYMDNLHIKNLKAKVEQFKFNPGENDIIVIYRLGRQKLLHKMDILSFEREYFEKVSIYDQHRLTKFSTLQKVIKNLFYKNSCNKIDVIKYIQESTENDNLF
jgi:hypothetical protein